MKGLAPLATLALLALAPHAAAAGPVETESACYVAVWTVPVQCARGTQTRDEAACTRTECTVGWTLALRLEGSAYSCGRATNDLGQVAQACGMPGTGDSDGPLRTTHERRTYDYTVTVTAEVCSYIVEGDQNCRTLAPVSVLIPKKAQEEPGSCPVAPRDDDACGGTGLPGLPEGVGLATVLALLP